jgi:SAM-dependent methyltransferase
MKFPFTCPSPAGFASSPEWNGERFVAGGISTSVLEYSENFAGWSDDLTAMHEEVAGNSHPIDLASRSNALSQIRRILPNGEGVILEIGCSSGFMLREMKRDFPKALILGADVVKAPLYRIAEEQPGIPLFRFDLLKCPLPDEIADVVVMLNVFEHIEDDVGAMSHVFKLLKSGGALIVEVPSGRRLYDKYDEELHHFRRYSSAELRAKLKGVGFTLDWESHLGFLLFPFFALAKHINQLSIPKARKDTVVQASVAQTAGSPLFKIAMDLERKYFSKNRLPFGIRVVAVAKKPKK